MLMTTIGDLPVFLFYLAVLFPLSFAVGFWMARGGLPGRGCRFPGCRTRQDPRRFHCPLCGNRYCADHMASIGHYSGYTDRCLLCQETISELTRRRGLERIPQTSPENQAMTNRVGQLQSSLFAALGKNITLQSPTSTGEDPAPRLPITHRSVDDYTPPPSPPGLIVHRSTGKLSWAPVIPVSIAFIFVCLFIISENSLFGFLAFAVLCFGVPHSLGVRQH